MIERVRELLDCSGRAPDPAASSADVLFAEDDGSHGRLTGILDALTPAAVTPGEP
ncbi:MAG: hypothetical protein OXI74_01205 [Rhodospirillaceae bacterium]|nr:hypothetical protein [Rhodospirillaceae bacterium]